MVPTQVTREESDRDREREVQQLDGANPGHVFKLVTPDTGTWACRCVGVI